MTKYLEPRYLVYLVVASVIALVALQVTGEGQALQADPLLERLESDRDTSGDRHRERSPTLERPEASGDRPRWRLGGSE